jgi:hypothetical protein
MCVCVCYTCAHGPYSVSGAACLFVRSRVKDHDALIDPTRMHSTPRRLGVNVRWNATHRRFLSHVAMSNLLSCHTRDTVAARTLAARTGTRIARASAQHLASFFRCAFVSLTPIRSGC